MFEDGPRLIIPKTLTLQEVVRLKDKLNELSLMCVWMVKWPPPPPPSQPMSSLSLNICAAALQMPVSARLPVSRLTQKCGRKSWEVGKSEKFINNENKKVKNTVQIGQNGYHP